MARSQDRVTTPEPPPAHARPIDADESGALAIGLMVAVIVMVALLTFAMFISIP